MTFSQAVRYMMDQCDRHGLHHEVLEEFMSEYQNLFNANTQRCHEGQEQIAPDFARMARNALWEWDIG